MQGRSAYFFADEKDLQNLILQFDELGDFKYLETQSELNHELLIFSKAADLIPHYLVESRGVFWPPQYLLFDATTEPYISKIELTNGSGTNEGIDQYTNPDTVELRFGGEYGDKVLKISDICTLGDTQRSLDMHKMFKKLVLKNTQRFGEKGTPFRLMPGALDKYKAGWRLVAHINQTEEYDYKIPQEQIDGNYGDKSR